MSKICRNCGSHQSDSAKFCEECGSVLSASVIETATEVVEAEVVGVVKSYDSPAADAREVRERLIGTKLEYYLPRFEKMENLNSVTSWNWPAFIVGCNWMLYRKMYGFGVALWVVSQVINLLGVPLLNWAVWIGTGVLGNYLYMKDINNRTEKAMNMQPDEREVYIQKNSGTGWTAVLIACVVSVILTTMLG